MDPARARDTAPVHGNGDGEGELMSSVVLLGSGALARSVCYSLAVSTTPMTVTVAARNGARAAEIAYVGNVRAALSGSPVRCRAVPSQLADPLELSRVLAATMPAIVLLTASLHSPCERLTNPSSWTKLLDRTGFGVTAPLHALLAITAAEVVAQTGHARLLVASFPDAVNPILAALGLPVFAGVGNAALLTASLRAALDVHPRTRVRMLAHHVHLDPPDSPANEARAWIGGTQVPDVTSALAAQRATDRSELNLIAGHSAALLIKDLVSGAEIHTTLPGPLGLPGGYPVRIVEDVELDLPEEVTLEDAIGWNRAAGRRDGFDIDGGHIRFSERAIDALEPHLSGLSGGFPVEELGTVAGQLLDLRTKLRTTPE
jgi:hypothetical protein